MTRSVREVRAKKRYVKLTYEKSILTLAIARFGVRIAQRIIFGSAAVGLVIFLNGARAWNKGGASERVTGSTPARGEMMNDDMNSDCKTTGNHQKPFGMWFVSSVRHLHLLPHKTGANSPTTTLSRNSEHIINNYDSPKKCSTIIPWSETSRVHLSRERTMSRKGGVASRILECNFMFMS